MAIKGFDQNAIAFDPFRGNQVNVEIYNWTEKNGAQATSGRLRLNMGTWAQGVLTVLAQAELIAHFALGKPLVVTGGSPIGMVLGGNRDAMREAIGDAKMKPACDAYFAAQAWARRIPEAICPPYAIDLEFLPTPAGQAAANRAALTSAPVGAIWIVAGVTVALGAVAACAYWAGKREDAQASVQLGTLRTTAALDAATKLALVQVAAGMPVDPQLYDVFKAAGTEQEQRHGMWIGVAAGGGAVLTLGGVIGAIWGTRDASSSSSGAST